MALILSSSQVNLDGIDTPTSWHTDGVTEDDFEIARECGLITPRYDKTLDLDISFNKMIDHEEEFNEDGYNSIDEINHAFNGSSFECENPNLNEAVCNVDVRVVMKKTNFSIGTIDGDNNVYIPAGLMNMVTIGEIVKMNLVYHPQGKNKWKAIFIHRKESPTIVSQFMSLNINNECDMKTQTYHIPKQNIGKMVGKNGICIQKVLNDITYRDNEMKCIFKMKEDNKNVDMSHESVPQFDITNIEEISEVKVWDVPNTRVNSNKEILQIDEFDPVEDVFMKLYC